MSRVTLGDVAVERKETLKGAKVDYPTVGLEHLIPKQITLTTWGNGSDTTFTKVFHKGQVLFGRRRAYLKKAAVAPFDGLCSGDITVIEAKADLLLPELLLFVIQNDVFFDFAVGKSAGSLSPRVKWEHLKKYEFELPDMAEQRKLAELLWSMAEAKEAYQELLRQTDELVKAQFIEMFGDPVENPMSWKTVPFLKTGNCKNGMNFSNKESGIQIECLGVADFQQRMLINDSVQLSTISLNEMPSTEYLLKDGDIVFVRSNGNKELVGRSALVVVGNKKVTFSGFCIRYRKALDELNHLYLLHLLRADSIRAKLHGRGANVQNLSQKTLAAIDVPIPPLSLQEQFVAYVHQSDKSKFELEKAVKALEITYNKIISENLG